MSSSSLDHLSDFHAWLQQKREQKMSFLPWVRTLLNDETIMGMKWDNFVGKPRPNRAGKKLDAFNALFQVFSKEKSKVPMGAMTQGVKEEEKEDTAAPLGIWPLHSRKIFFSLKKTKRKWKNTTGL